MVELMLTAGLRISELSKLKWSHIRWKEGKLLIKEGKGEKDRNFFIPESLVMRLKIYKEEAPESVFVFATRTGKQIDRCSANKMIKHYAKKAGIEKNVYNHLLRHTALTDLYTDTKDIRLVQQVAGHVSQTTQIYTHISAVEVRISMSKEKY
ncbi:MAG: tyrosine-type recombinase/integrase [Bacteroidetes bacterium]|nr:tyrosine-type recombinase/integrase [Bacteroidota bacterium]